MSETLLTFRCFAGRFKFICALLAIFCGSALLTIGACAWYYGSIIEQGAAAYDRQITRLTADVDTERVVNRAILAQLTEQVKRNADTLDQVTDKAQDAAKTAKSAATTAKGAATNAARANVTVKETPAATAPKRIEARQVEP